MKRSILIQHNDNREDIELELSKAAIVDTNQEFIHLDKMKDGKWRIVASKSIIDDFTKVSQLKFYRDIEDF